MSNELVTFGRVPKSTMDTSPTVPGKLWVTNDPQNDNNPDNLAEAYVDDLPNRRMKITDRDLVNRVGKLESAETITDPEIEEIVRSVGGDPASPLNFKNNIMFVNSEIDDSDAEEGNANIILNPNCTLPNLEMPYNLILITYPTNFPWGMYRISNLKLTMNSDTEISFDTSIIKGADINVDTQIAHCFPEGTYVFKLTVSTDNIITLNTLYIFTKRNQVVLENGTPVLNQNSAKVLSYNASPKRYLFGNDQSKDSLSYIDTSYGAYIIACTDSGSDTPSTNGWRSNIFITGYVNQFVYKYMNINDLNDITLMMQSGISYKFKNINSKSISPNSHLRIKKVIHESITYFYADLYVPNNGTGNSFKKLIFFLPNY